jgi:hypothetical protein
MTFSISRIKELFVLRNFDLLVPGKESGAVQAQKKTEQGI